MASEVEFVGIVSVSLDGKLAAYKGQDHQERQRGVFASKADQELLRSEYLACDAIIIGAETARIDGVWHYPSPDRKPPRWFVITHFGKNLETVVATCAREGIPLTLVSPNANTSPADAIVREMKHLGLSRALLFGGGHVYRMFFEAQLIRQLFVTLVPTIIGQKAPSFIPDDLTHPPVLHLKSINQDRDHCLLHYVVK